MIKKMTSKELMETLQDSEESIKKVEDTIDILKFSLDERLAVIKNFEEYSSKEMEELKQMQTHVSAETNNCLVLARNEIMIGNYDKYGSTFHPELTKTPTNIFNFSTAAGVIFKDNASVLLNETIKDNWKGMLMDDSIENQPIAFAEFAVPDFTLTVNIQSKELIGTSSCNMIELLPYIPGSFDITGIDLFSIQDEKINNTVVPTIKVVKTIKDAGASRIILDKTLNLQKAIFHIHLKYQNSNGKYPFGLKHMYFLKASFNPESYLIVKVHRDSYIDWISENIEVGSPSATNKSSCSIEGIKLYMDYNNGDLSYEISTSNGIIQNPLSRNIKDFYMYIPIVKCIETITFEKISDR